MAVSLLVVVEEVVIPMMRVVAVAPLIQVGETPVAHAP